MAYQGLVVVITGGASGMGNALAHQFIEQGAKVVIGDIQEQMGEAAAKELSGKSGSKEAAAVFHKTDVTNWESTRALFDKAVSEFGTVDIAIANAGISKGYFPLPPDRPKREAPNLAEMDIDLGGVIYTTQAAIDVMRVKPDPATLPESEHPFRRKWRGKIVSTSSIAAIYCLTMSPVYSAAKAGVWMLMQSTGLLLIGEKITCNCVAPAIVDTPIYQVAPEVMAKAHADGAVTPMSTIMKAFFSFLPPEVDITGQLAEANMDQVVNRTWVPYLNETTKNVWEAYWFQDHMKNYPHGHGVLPIA